MGSQSDTTEVTEHAAQHTSIKGAEESLKQTRPELTQTFDKIT